MTTSDAQAAAPVAAPSAERDRNAVLAALAWSLPASLGLFAFVWIAAGLPAHPERLLQVGRAFPARAAFENDMRDPFLTPGDGHDGQQFYAVAREPMHLRDAAKYLDSARYREQRIGFPLSPG